MCRGAPVPLLLLSVPDLREVARSPSCASVPHAADDPAGWQDILDGAGHLITAGGGIQQTRAGRLTAVHAGDGGLCGIAVWPRVSEQGMEHQAHRAAAAKSRFFAAASHDLRQPFQAMRLFLGVLMGQLNDDSQRKTAGMVGQAMASGEALLNALLDISTLEAGTVQPKPETFALDGMCGRLVAEFAPQARDKGLRLRTRLLRAHVHTDSVLLERVLRNLIGNALRYTRHGKILVAMRRRGNTIRLEIWDTGFGIPAEQRAAIFDEFHQLENPARDKTRGLGLGLAIVRRVCGLLGFPLELRSTLGRGSVFVVTLPLAEAVPPACEATVPHGAGLSGRRLLVVDDDALVLDGLSAMLASWQLRVLPAEDMAGVLRALDEAEPEAILTDLRLPNSLSGFEVIDRVRAILGKPLPAVVLTGETGKAALTEGRRRGLTFLHKPIQADQLRAALEGALAE